VACAHGVPNAEQFIRRALGRKPLAHVAWAARRWPGGAALPTTAARPAWLALATINTNTVVYFDSGI
jgi:hypothetical protein